MQNNRAVAKQKNVILNVSEESESAYFSVRLHMKGVMKLDRLHGKILRQAQNDTKRGYRVS